MNYKPQTCFVSRIISKEVQQTKRTVMNSLKKWELCPSCTGLPGDWATMHSDSHCRRRYWARNYASGIPLAWLISSTPVNIVIKTRRHRRLLFCAVSWLSIIISDVMFWYRRSWHTDWQMASPDVGAPFFPAHFLAVEWRKVLWNKLPEMSQKTSSHQHLIVQRYTLEQHLIQRISVRLGLSNIVCISMRSHVA